MRMHRFIGQFNKVGDVIKVEDKEIVSQIKNVLKLRNGEQIILGDGNGDEMSVEIIGVKENIIEGRVIKKNKNENETDVYGILYCAILKKENFEIVAQKATELGIREIAPIITERTVKLNLNYERLNKIIKEAGEQSGRGKLPILREAMTFREAIESAKVNDLNLFLDISGDKIEDLSASWRTKKLKAKKVGLFIGPEGGWTENELKYLNTKILKNFEIVSLGRTTLRAETAAIAGSFLVSSFI